MLFCNQVQQDPSSMTKLKLGNWEEQLNYTHFQGQTDHQGSFLPISLLKTSRETHEKKGLNG